MTSTTKSSTTQDAPSGSLAVRVAIAWTVVGVPLAYGVLKTVQKASALFV